ncbi:hypothetical protein ACSQ67_023592 [Phaseolus vulgaris]
MVLNEKRKLRLTEFLARRQGAPTDVGPSAIAPTNATPLAAAPPAQDSRMSLSRATLPPETLSEPKFDDRSQCKTSSPHWRQIYRHSEWGSAIEESDDVWSGRRRMASRWEEQRDAEKENQILWFGKVKRKLIKYWRNEK